MRDRIIIHFKDGATVDVWELLCMWSITHAVIHYSALMIIVPGNECCNSRQYRLGIYYYKAQFTQMPIPTKQKCQNALQHFYLCEWKYIIDLSCQTISVLLMVMIRRSVDKISWNASISRLSWKGLDSFYCFAHLILYNKLKFSNSYFCTYLKLHTLINNNTSDMWIFLKFLWPC